MNQKTDILIRILYMLFCNLVRAFNGAKVEMEKEFDCGRKNKQQL